MNPIDFVNKVKELFNEAPATKESQAKFVEYTLDNGTTVSIDKYEVGGVVTLADGTLAPMGEYILADGTTFKVDEAGVILEISLPKEETIQEVSMQIDEAMVTEMKDKIAKLEEELAMIKEQLSGEVAKQEEVALSMYSKFESAIKDLASAIEGLANTATADPIDAPSSFQKIEKKNEKINRFLEMAKKVK